MGIVRNVGTVDKSLRLVAGAALLLIGLFVLGLDAATGILAAVVGAVLIVTGAVNFCPLFRLLGISSFRP